MADDSDYGNIPSYNPDLEELGKRFIYHPPSEQQTARYKALRAHGLAFAVMLATHCPQSRELSLALTKVEEAVMHACSGIARRE